MIRKYSKLIVPLAIITNISVGEEFVLPSVTTGSNALKEIKARVNNNRENYNYIEVNNQEQYERLKRERGSNLGISTNGKHRHQEVINVVKIRNVRDKNRYSVDRRKYLHHDKEYDKNLGIRYKGNASNKNFTNIVNIKNSQLGGRINSGTSISTRQNIHGSTINNSTRIINSTQGK